MAKIEVTILGTTAGVPTRERSHPAIYLVYRGEKEFCYLFDCGEGTQRQILFANLNFMKINEIFITHWHGDHYLGLPGLVDTMGFENRKKPLTIFAPDVKRARSLLNIGYFSREFKIILKDVPCEGELITELINTDDFKIVSTPVEHFVPAVGYALLEKDKLLIDKEKARQFGLPDKGVIYREIKEKGEIIFKGKHVKLESISKVRRGKKVVYSGDTRICDNLIKLSENADLLIQDCTYFNFDGESFEDYGHASFRDVLKMMEKIEVKKVILTHISRRYKDKEKLKKMIDNYQNLEIAEDFMKINI